VEGSAPVFLRAGEAPAVWRHLREAWELFIADGVVPARHGLRPLILDSWQAARKRGIDPFLPTAPLIGEADELGRVFAENDFGQAGRRVIDQMVEVLEGHALLLSDANGRIVHVAGDREVAEALERVNARPGGVWTEPVVGPNGIGAALATRGAAAIFGPEHFCENWQHWVCYGAPVNDPLSGELLGIIDISGLAERARVSQLPVAVSMAHSIEYLLVDSCRQRRQCLMDAYDAALRRWPIDAVAAFDAASKLVAANDDWRECARSVGDRPLVHSSALAELLQHPPMDGEIPAALSSAVTRGARVEIVRAADRNVGVVVVLERREPFHHGSNGGSDAGPEFGALVGRDPEFRKALRIAARAASSDEAVLISGETGTGKELVARAIHQSSRRAGNRLVCVNCAALPRELIESELFGYEGGAFTGARREGKPGRFELADGGTLLLDEIGELTVEAQAKLLRVVEEGTVLRVGGSRPRPIDVRIVAATNRDLSRAVATGEFRADLFYRIGVIEISLPPLHARRGDVLDLARAFLDTACRRAGRGVLRLTPQVERLLLRYPWPGNVRELRNMMARFATLVDGDEVAAEDLPATLRGEGSSVTPPRDCSLRATEDDLIQRTLSAVGGNVSEAARRLDIDRSTIYRWLRRS
jgi:sigma-54 dependent transcriptional regulator, acetoin dehydrogenase operon transcriptional activator AcoR